MENQEALKITGIWKAVVKNAETGDTTSIKEVANLIPTVGREAMAIQHSGNNTQQMKVQHIAVGSSTTAPANGDTTLGAEVARKAITSRSENSIESSVAAFFAAGDATGTHREFGAFGDGNASTSSLTSDSGIMYSHTSANVTIASNETLTLTLRTTFN